MLYVISFFCIALVLAFFVYYFKEVTIPWIKEKLHKENI
jgi:lipopolysaccharide export LptBFGC system permease protein LptF